MALLVFLLSLAGIPFVVGFWAKMFVFLAAWQAGYAWLVVLGAVFSVVALFYYLRIARSVFMNPAQDPEPIVSDAGTDLAIDLCVAAVVMLGLQPLACGGAAGSGGPRDRLISLLFATIDEVVDLFGLVADALHGGRQRDAIGQLQTQHLSIDPVGLQLLAALARREQRAML